MLDEASTTIWNAYENGLGTQIKAAYRAACVIANLVTELVIDMEIALCCERVLEVSPGLFVLLQSLESAISRDCMNS